MAEKDIVEKSVEDLEKEITCAICHDHYTEPKVLPCCHYYCKQCIHRLTLRTGINKPFSCPECRKDTALPQGNIDQLPTAFFLNRMKELHSKLERAHGKVDAKCEMCSGDKAEAFCRQCTQFICAECVKSHHRMKVFAGHKIASLDELKEGAKEIVMEESPLQMCKKHDESMKMYCFDCSLLICRDCTVKDHFGHNYEFVKECAPEMKKKLVTHLEPLKKVKVELSHAVEEIQTTQHEIEAQGDSVADHINSSFDELQKILENRRQELLKEAALKVREKLEHLSGQEKSLSTSCAVLQSVIEYTEQCVEHSTGDEVMCMHAEIKSRIDREIEEHCKEGRSLDPVEEVDIGVEVSCAEDLKKLCQTKAKIISLSIDPTKCTVVGEGIKIAEVDKKCEFSLTPKLTNGKHTKRECTVTGQLKSLMNDSNVKCNIDRSEGNEYRISYTPTVCGCHELTVTVNGQEVAGSPFPVFVSIHPSKLSKPVKIIPGLNHPTDVTFNSKGEMIVTGFNADVVMLDKKGKKLRNVKRSEYKFKYPRSVAVDKEDNIYFVDGNSNTIYKSNKNMTKVTAKQVGEQSGHRGVTVVGDEVMVTEHDNHGTIKVYTTELEYVREIVSRQKGTGTFDRMSSDKHGNLYISVFNKNPCVQVLSNRGEVLHSFGRKELSDPRGVCVTDEYVYVANFDKHNIEVYTTKGEHVTSFGQYGNDEGHFYSPRGVNVDKDGLLYVCDDNNNRLQIF